MKTTVNINTDSLDPNESGNSKTLYQVQEKLQTYFLMNDTTAKTDCAFAVGLSLNPNVTNPEKSGRELCSFVGAPHNIALALVNAMATDKEQVIYRTIKVAINTYEKHVVNPEKNSPQN